MIYIYTFAASIFFAYLAERSRDKKVMILCSIISILIPSVLGGLRAHGVGTDTRGYGIGDAMQALSSPNLMYFINNNRCEPGYKILVYFTMQTFGHENWCYFFYQLITITGIYIGAYKHRKSVHMPLTLLTFYFIWYQYSYNAMRQCIAASIIFMGLDTMENRQYRKFLVYIVIATLFHYSAIIALFLLLGIHFVVTSEYFSKNGSIKTFVLYGGIVLIIFARLLINFIIGGIPFLSKYGGYLNSTQYGVVPVSTSFLGIAFGEILMFIFYYEGGLRAFSNLGKENFEFHIYNVVFYSVYQIFVMFFSKRILLYSYFANLVMLSSLPSFVKEKNLKTIIAMAVIAVVVVYWWHDYIYMGNSETWPYKSIL